MLVTLSLAHLSSKKFEKHQEMVNFLSENGFLNFPETKKVMMDLDRRDFLQNDNGTDSSVQYALKAQNYCQGVDVSNPIMQALMLDCVYASISGAQVSKINMLDIGTATGFLAYSSEKLFSGQFNSQGSKFTGIDLSEPAINKAEALKAKLNPACSTSFLVDDFYHHLEIFNKYNLIVSGCGLTQADIVGSILSKIETQKELILIAPVFTSSKEQQLRIHYPKEKSDRILENLAKIPLFEKLQPREFSEYLDSVDLFTCFYSPIEQPFLAESYTPISEDMNLGKIQLKSEPKVAKPENFKKLNLAELTELLAFKQSEFKQLHSRLKVPGAQVSLQDINKTPEAKKLLEDISLLAKYKKSKEINN